MSQTKLGLYALLLEIVAWAQMGSGAGDERALAIYLLAHAAASALIAPFAWMLLPRMYRKPRLPVLLLIFSLSFFVPLLGFVSVIVGVLVMPLLPKFDQRGHFTAVALPQLDPHGTVGIASFRAVGVREFLRNTQVPLANRLKALLALQKTSTHVASPMLRDLLSDSQEDLRLLAYNMLDAREKKINASIEHERARFDAAKSHAERLAPARRLGELYWEMVYQGLVQGDLMQHCLAEALRFTDLARAGLPEDAGLRLQLARLQHYTRDLQAARENYVEAMGLGLPLTRVVPYLAELEFDQRNFDEVRKLMSVLHSWAGLARLQPVIRYWSSP